uniref:C2H2-type domain-containing protein n=1 Tax=Panagrellus redivivus TaxID=6233 RepID=A0A7E4VKR4_PANRE
MKGGCRGFASSVLNWPEQMILGGVKPISDDSITAEALQSVILRGRICSVFPENAFYQSCEKEGFPDPEKVRRHCTFDHPQDYPPFYYCKLCCYKDKIRGEVYRHLRTAHKEFINNEDVSDTPSAVNNAIDNSSARERSVFSFGDLDDINDAISNKGQGSCLSDHESSVGALDTTAMKEKLMDLLTMALKAGHAYSDVDNMFQIVKKIVVSTTSTTLHDSIDAVFHDFCTRTRRERLLKLFVEPQKIPIDTSTTVKVRGDRGVLTKTEHNYTEVDLRSVLTKEFEVAEIADELRVSTDSSDGSYLEGILDAEKYKRLVENAGSEVLAISAFVDGSCPVNALGAKATTNNMTYVCVTVENLPDYIKSKSHGNMVIAAGYSSDFDADNYSTFKRRFTAQLKDLYRNGITIIVRGEPIHFRVVLIAWKGDNLGLNKFFGIHANFALGSACRRCDLTYGELDDHLDERSIINRMRKITDYKDDVAQKSRGVKQDSELHDVPDFHIYTNFFHNPMHDFKEGDYYLATAIQMPTNKVVLGWDRHVFLYILDHIKRKYGLTLTRVNEELNVFPYRIHDSATRPSNLTPHGIKESSEQMHCLMRLFALAVGNKVDEDDEEWQYFMEYIHLRQFIFAPRKTEAFLKKQTSMIERHLKSSVERKIRGDGPNPTLVFKAHFMLHLEEAEKQLGPLTLLSCLPYERIMAEMKKHMKMTKNFVNIPYSVMYRRQLERAVKCADWNTVFPDAKEELIIVGGSVKWYGEVFDYIENGCILATKILSVKGTKYHQYDVVVVDVIESVPLFGYITEIVKTPNYWAAILQIHSDQPYGLAAPLGALRAYAQNAQDQRSLLSYELFGRDLPTIAFDGLLMPTFKFILLEDGACNDFDEVTSSIHNETIENAIHRLAKGYGFAYEIMSVKMLMAGGTRKVTIHVSAVAAMVRHYEVVMKTDNVYRVAKVCDSEVGESGPDASTNSANTESIDVSTADGDADSVSSTEEPSSGLSDLTEQSRVTANRKRDAPTKPLRISKNVANTVLTPKLQETTLDSLYKNSNFSVFRDAVQAIKDGGIPKEKGRKSLIKTFATILCRHCAKENHPTKGEAGAFFLHLMKSYPHMLQVYDDWVGRPRGSYLMVCVENGRKTKKKRGEIESCEAKWGPEERSLLDEIDFGRKWALISSKFITAVEQDERHKASFEELKGWHEHFDTAHDKRCFHGFLALYVLSSAAYGRKSDKFDQAFVHKLGELNVENAIAPYKKRDFPFIIQLSEDNNNYYVRFLGRHVLIEGAFSDALEVYFATFWVFELPYPNPIKHFLKALETFVDIVPPPKKPWTSTMKELRRQVLEAASTTDSSADDE